MGGYCSLKILVFCLAMGAAYSIQCWECENARSEEECKEKGRLTQCQETQEACQIEIRSHEGWNNTIRITKRCKQRLACENNQKQNDGAAWFPTQCNVAFFNSVCRCCCFGDSCNDMGTDCTGGVQSEKIQKTYFVRCNQPQAPTHGNVQCRGDPRNLNCSFQCQDGYKISGSKTLACDSSRGWSGDRPVCVKSVCPRLDNAIQFGSVQCSRNNQIGSKCTFRCQSPYKLVGDSVSTCLENAKWSSAAPTCKKAVERCPVISTKGFKSVECSKENLVGSQCTFLCEDTHTVAGASELICRSNKNWNQKIPSCKLRTCPKYAAAPPKNGIVTCTNENFIGSECKYSCKEGYLMVDPEVTLCQADGTWSYGIPTCKAKECLPAHTTPENGMMFCSSADPVIGTECAFTCYDGFVLNGSPMSTCTNNADGEVLGVWSEPMPSCDSITCSISDIEIENGESICTDDNKHGSVCSFVCDNGYGLSSLAKITCSKINSRGDWSDVPPTCEPIRCPKQDALENGFVTCSKNNFAGSECTYTCEAKFMLDGSPFTKCQAPADQGSIGSWSAASPTCIKRQCERIELDNGFTKCSEQFAVGSQCNFMCKDFHEFRGSETTMCVENKDGSVGWDEELPECFPIKCESQVLPHGEVTCTRDNFITSECDVACTEEGYELHPRDYGTNICLNSTVWNRPLPCCARRCPPFAYMDLVIAMDSSSSIGNENWVKMNEFVQEFVNTFIIGSDASNFGVFRYNRVVDKSTQMFLNHSMDINVVLDGVATIPYDGSGTNIGKALDHAREVMMKIGNRPNARDIVLLITDGRSQDDVVIPAKKLRDMGTIIYVIAIDNGGIDMSQVNAIIGTGYEYNKVFRTKRGKGFDDLTSEFTDVLSRTLCGDPCDHPQHDHD